MSNALAHRRDLIKNIQATRKSIVVCYVTSDREGLPAQIEQSAIRVIYDLAREVWDPANTDRFDLYVYSRGGDSNVPWALMSALREIVREKELNILIPYRCHSAATIMALGADNIIMGPKGELAPIDTTMTSEYNPRHPKTGQIFPISVEDVMGYFSLLKKLGCRKPKHKIQGLRELASNVHPYALGQVQRLEDQTKLVASQMLARRREPFAKKVNSKIMKALAKEIFSHHHAISRSEAERTIGLQNIVKTEEIGVDGLLWDLHLAYEDKFQMLEPFQPDDDFLSDPSLESKEHPDLPVACVETVKACKTQVVNVVVRRLREPVQSLTVNPQITLSPPAVPAGTDESQIQAILSEWLKQVASPVFQQAVDQVVRRAAQAVPTKGFQRRDYRRRWQEEQQPKERRTVEVKQTAELVTE